MEDTHEIRGTNLLESVRKFLTSLFDTGGISSILIPLRNHTTNALMPTLVSDPRELERADPFAPCFPMNAARLVSRLTKRPGDETIAVVLRPCELRALVELVKIRQAKMDNLITISFDCMGAYPNRVFNEKTENGENFTLDFIKQRLGSNLDDEKDELISTSCTICTALFPENADINLTLVGHDPGVIGIFPGTDKGRQLLMGQVFEEKALPEKRKESLKLILDRKSGAEKKVFEGLNARTSTLEGLGSYLSSCVNCYNCRVACPVCFCRECVFNTDVFDYEPFQYSIWAKNRGALRMPMDTVFFHLTRMVHMGLSCVGCGQCSNACPNDIKLSELFTAVGKGAQEGFGYVAGKSMEEPFPLSIFFEDEFQDVTGI